MKNLRPLLVTVSLSALLAACGSDVTSDSDNNGGDSHSDTGGAGGSDDDETGGRTGSGGRDGSGGRNSSGGDGGTGGGAPVDTCGDGVLDEGEQCDDDNLDTLDGCAGCEVTEGFSCDDSVPSVCTAVCGDGLIRDDEACDDEGVDSEDGCSAVCEIEDGFACDGSPSLCHVVCGDGLILGDEECDDDNTENNDGCSESCTLEDGFVCDDAEPTACDALCSGFTDMLRDPATDHCYLRVTKNQNWPNARALCEDLGGNLAAVSSSDERALVLAKGWGLDQHWIGGSDFAEEGTWVWSNGEAWTDSLTPGTPPWAAGEPNNAESAEHCLHYTTNSNWNDVNCSSELGGALCELPTSPVLESACGDGVDGFVFGGPEQCDDGNAIGDDDCTNTCRSNICDDGACHPTSAIMFGQSRSASNATVCVPLVVTDDDVTANPSHIWVSTRISHDWASDASFELRSPSNTSVLLVNNRGGSQAYAPNKTLVFYDEATTPVSALDSDGGVICNGNSSCSFSPEESLSALLSENLVGTWSFCVKDVVTADAAHLHAARLSLF